MVGSRISQKMAFSGSSMRSMRLGDHRRDFMARPFPLRTSSVTAIVRPSAVTVAPQFCIVTRYLLASQPMG